MNISWSISITNARMQKRELTVDEFMAVFNPANVREQATKDGPNYIAGRLLDYSKPRGKGNIIDRCAVVLDCDDADRAGIKALVEAVKNLGVRSVVHSTYSSTPDKPRVRVVIPLTGDVVPGDYVNLCKALMNHLNMVQWDESCAQAERAMYMPAKPVGGEYWAVQAQGPLMDGTQWLKAHAPAPTRKQRTSKGNVAKRDRNRKPQSDPGIRGAFNRVYTITSAIEEFDLPYEPCREGRWTYYGADSEGGLRLVEDREDLCISEHANTDPACYIDGNGSHRALSAFELCAIHLYGDDDDTSLPPRERASMQAMAKRAAEDEAVRGDTPTADIAWLFDGLDDVDMQAEHAAEALRDELAYSEGLGWLTYYEDLGIWKCASVSAALERVAPVVRGWYYAVQLSDDDKFIKKAAKLRNSGNLRAILTHIEAKVAVPADSFDVDPDLLCVRNGVVDLRTGKLMPHSPTYYMTQQTAVPYHEGATNETWSKVLEALDAPERAWFQQWLGCGITGHQPRDREASVPILSGIGSNGKSLLVTGVMRAMGTYARVNSQDLLMPENRSAFAHAAVALRALRLGLVEELPDGMLNGNAVKMLACTPTMVAEAKYQMPFEFKTTHSLMVTTNSLPRLDESTDGLNRRLAVLRFPYHYVDSPKPGSDERLKDESLLDAVETTEVQEAVLAWLVAGARKYYAAGKHVGAPTEAMKAEKNVWLSDADTLGRFFNDMLVEDPEGMIPSSHLYAAFCDHQQGNNGKPWNNSTFKNRMASHRVFSQFKFGKLRTTGMSLYRDEFGNGPKAPTGGRAVGMRGVRFRTDADEFVEPVGMYVEPEVAAPAVEPEALIPVEDVLAPTPHVAPEREELERLALIEELDGLACFVQQLPGGVEEVNSLAYEMGATSRQAPLNNLRAFKVRLEGALVRLSIQQCGQERRQE